VGYDADVRSGYLFDLIGTMGQWATTNVNYTFLFRRMAKRFLASFLGRFAYTGEVAEKNSALMPRAVLGHNLILIRREKRTNLTAT